MRYRGSSLLELVIVLVIVGIIAAIAVPRLSTSSVAAKAAAAAAAVCAIQQVIDVQTGLDDGEYPAAIDEAWFSGGHLPPSPFDIGATVKVRVSSAGSPEKLHPKSKIVTDTPPGAYWNDPDNGIVRARVVKLRTNAATVDLYNQVNQTAITVLSE